jgi:hypothetical protein
MTNEEYNDDDNYKQWKEHIEEYEAELEKYKKIEAIESWKEDPTLSAKVNALAARVREVRAMAADLDRTKKEKIWEAGKFLAEHRLVTSLDQICRHLKRDFKGVINPTFIQNCCPPEWRPKK